MLLLIAYPDARSFDVINDLTHTDAYMGYGNYANRRDGNFSLLFSIPSKPQSSNNFRDRNQKIHQNVVQMRVQLSLISPIALRINYVNFDIHTTLIVSAVRRSVPHCCLTFYSIRQIHGLRIEFNFGSVGLIGNRIRYTIQSVYFLQSAVFMFRKLHKHINYYSSTENARNKLQFLLTNVCVHLDR